MSYIPCCSTFKDIINTMEWMGLGENLIMPHYTIQCIKFRVNFCPSCGKNIREIEVPYKESKKW